MGRNQHIPAPLDRKRQAVEAIARHGWRKAAEEIGVSMSTLWAWKREVGR